jgi:four helix bundle protein
MSKKILSHKELAVWQDALDAAMDIFHMTKTFPAEEKYSLVDQIRRSSRSVAANISKRGESRYEARSRAS